MSSYDKLIEGYKAFRHQYLSEENDTWREWAKDGQNPKVMVIACSDSRVNPVIITHAGLGDLFVVNNVANLVPPYEEKGDSYHGTSAAIEFAVNNLKVDHIIIMGHSGCGGVRSLMDAHDREEETGEADPGPEGFSFIRPWMEIVSSATEFTVEERTRMTVKARATVCERRATLISLNNLAGFPWVRDAMKAKSLKIHAWHFDIASGTLQEYNTETAAFEELV